MYRTTIWENSSCLPEKSPKLQYIATFCRKKTTTRDDFPGCCSKFFPSELKKQAVARLIKEYRDVSLRSPFLLQSIRKTKKEMISLSLKVWLDSVRWALRLAFVGWGLVTCPVHSALARYGESTTEWAANLWYSEKWKRAFAFLLTKPSRSTGNYPLSESLVINCLFFFYSISGHTNLSFHFAYRRNRNFFVPLSRGVNGTYTQERRSFGSLVWSFACTYIGLLVLGIITCARRSIWSLVKFFR